MRKGILTLCLNLIVIIGSAGVTSATPMYSVTLPLFTHGLDLETGQTYQHPELEGTAMERILIIVNGAVEDIDQVVGIENFEDFRLYPDVVDLHFEYETNDRFLLVPNHAMQIGFLDNMTFDEVDYGVLTGLTFTPVTVGEYLEFNPEDILAFKLPLPSSDDPLWRPFWVMDLTYYSGLEPIEADVKGVIPEPATLILLGLGLLGLVGIVRRRKQGKSVHKQITIFILLMVVVGTASAAFGAEITITVQKEGNGEGTVMVGDVECGSDCEEKSITLPQNAAVILKALPAPESDFRGWTYADGAPITLEKGVLNADGTNVSIVAYFGIEAFIEEFAPILKFDGSASGYGYPMSAQTYWEALQNEDPRLSDESKAGIENTDLGKIQRGEVPTYYQILRTKGQIRIMYWWFYGMQHPCLGSSGRHHGDWERIMVTLKEDTSGIAAVTFWQHKGHYTRIAGPRDAPCTPGGIGRCDGPSGFLSEGTHPVVYVGKIAHGSYHNSNPTGPGGCGYFADFREPGSGDRMETWENLVNLGGNAESWITADREGGFAWGPDGVSTHPTQKGPTYDIRACEGVVTAWDWGTNGCFKSECLSGDDETAAECLKECEPGYTNMGLTCNKGIWPWEWRIYGRLNSGKHYDYDYIIPSVDAGLSRRRNNISEWGLP